MINRILILAGLAICCLPLSAQNILNSPYTRLGFGEMEDENYMAVRNMGGLASSWADPYYVNKANPASLSFLKTTAYEVGVYAQRSRLDDGNQKTEQWGGKFNYLGLAFPLYNPINEAYENIDKKFRFAMGFDLNRVANIGYNITSVDSTEELGVFTRNYNGEGGAYEFSWSNSVQHKDFSFGVKMGYLFGNTSYQRSIAFNEKANSFSNDFEDAYFVKGFTYNLGLMYHKEFGRTETATEEQVDQLVIGLRYNGGTKFTSIGDEVAFGAQVIGNGTIIRDTVYENLDLRGKGFLPGKFGFGANYRIGSRYGFGFEYNIQPWSNYYHELKGDVKNELRDAVFVSFGGFIRPDYKSYDNYFKRMTYRYGLYYYKDARLVDGVGIEQMGVRLGVGLPFVYQRRSSSANIGLDFGRRGKDTVIEENYVKINFGFTFNDEGWFLKRKYN